MNLRAILNKDDLGFLKAMAQELKTQDRRGTSKPVIYNILDINIRWDNDCSDGFDTVKIYDKEGDCLETLEDMQDYIIENPEEFDVEKFWVSSSAFTTSFPIKQTLKVVAPDTT